MTIHKSIRESASYVDQLGSLPWWVDRIGYQVYVPSFVDSNGDGWGDLQGLISRLNYLADLGADLLWLSPVHPSPFEDHGYDVADYMAINPRYGTLDDFDQLIDEANRLGIKVLLDLVPNHTSKEHIWFHHSRESRTSPFREYYIWRDPAADGGPPNNWVSAFGGPAWSYDAPTGQYYLHLFTPSQPDLNWSDPRVANEFDVIMRFWLERGIAGFRVDIAHGMVKAPGLPDQPGVPHEQRTRSMTGLPDEWFSLEHIYDHDQPGVVEIHRRWRRVVDPYDALLLGEVYLLDSQKLARYLVEQDGLHLSFWFALVESRWEPDRFTELLRAADAAGPHLVWVQSSHDRSRAVSRYGGGSTGRRRAMMMTTLTIGLPALPMLYQGEELGLDDGVILVHEIQDPLVRQGGYPIARDVARTPMPWIPDKQLGFTSAPRAWISLGERTARDTVAVQEDDDTSPLAVYRRLFATRHRLADLRRGFLRWIDAALPLLAYQRGSCVVAANVGAESASLVLPGGYWQIEFSTDGAADGLTVRDSVSIEAEQAVILRSIGLSVDT